MTTITTTSLRLFLASLMMTMNTSRSSWNCWGNKLGTQTRRAQPNRSQSIHESDTRKKRCLVTFLTEPTCHDV